MKELNTGDMIKWHNASSDRYTKGVVLEVLGTRWTNNHKVRVYWVSGEVTLSERWQLFLFDD
jgi:hypothetical protein